MGNGQYISAGPQQAIDQTKEICSIINEVGLLKEELDDPTQLDMKKYIKQLENLGKIVQNTPIIDPSIKEKLEIMTYYLIYDFMKLEVLSSSEETIQKKVKNGLIPTVYLAKFIHKDMSFLSKEEKELVRTMREKMEQDELNSEDLVNREMIKILATATKDTFIKERCQKMNEIYQEYLTEKAKLNPAAKEVAKATDEYEISVNAHKLFRSKLLKRFTLYSIPFLCAGKFVIDTGIMKELIDTDQLSKLNITTYNPQTEETKEEEVNGFFDETYNDNKIIIEETWPWEQDPKNKELYSRTKKTYLVDKEDDLSLPDYLKIKNYEECKTEVETKENKPWDYGYQNNKYLVKSVEHLDPTLIRDLWVLVHILLCLYLVLICIMILTFMEMVADVWHFDGIGMLLEKNKAARDDKKLMKIELEKKTKEFEDILDKCLKTLYEMENNPNSFLIREEGEKEKNYLLKR